MKTFYIVKKAPTQWSNGRARMANNPPEYNTVYSSFEDALNKARKVAVKNKGRYVVMKCVSAFEPDFPPVREVEITEGEA